MADGNHSSEALLNKVLDTYQEIVSAPDGDFKRADPEVKYKTFAISAFRGGIGKTTLTFNLSYEIAKNNRLLLADVCPQRNFSEQLMGKDLYKQHDTVYNALFSRIAGTGIEDVPQQLSRRVKDTNSHFSETKPCWMIPGDTEMFLFPSQLYTQLNQMYSLTQSEEKKRKYVGRVLRSMATILQEESRDIKPDITLIDTSPFFAGGTHLAWCAAEALVIPVRVDEHSLFALELTLQMLDEKQREFHVWNGRAETGNAPKIAAIMMTHVGWNRQSQGGIDRASKIFITRAIEVAHRYRHLFSTENVVSHFALLSDFQGAGRISGNQRIPLSKLRDGESFTVNGQRVEVNSSIKRYKRELAYATSLLAYTPVKH